MDVTRRDLSAERSERGVVQVFTGDGRGKTSAALGSILRAVGHGLKVYVVFFMKGDYPYGERRALGLLPNVTVESFGQEDFVDRFNIKPEQTKAAAEALDAARKAMLSGGYDLVVLDEVNVAVAFKLVPLEVVLRLIAEKPPRVDLILTGRLADPRLIQAADLVTEMVKIKHPYDKGMPARKGVEY